MSFATEKLDLNVSADYDDDREGLLLQWNPHAGIQMNKAVLAMSDIATPVYIPSIDFQYDTTGAFFHHHVIVAHKFLSKIVILFVQFEIVIVHAVKSCCVVYHEFSVQCIFASGS